MLITLHNMSDQEIIINLVSNEVASIQPAKEKSITIIELKSRKRYFVKESPGEVLEMIRNSERPSRAGTPSR